MMSQRSNNPLPLGIGTLLATLLVAAPFACSPKVDTSSNSTKGLDGIPTSNPSSPQTPETTGSASGTTTWDTKTGASKMPEEIPDGPRDNGLPCDTDVDCKSQICTEVPSRRMGKPVTELRCSECRDDSACVAKNPQTYCMVDRKLRAKVCADGSLGDTCENTEQCKAGTVCTKVNLGDNEAVIMACSSCTQHSDCTDPTTPFCISRPEDSWRPYNKCQPEGVRKNGEVCFPCDTGDQECEGFCVKVETPGKFCLGVCGECVNDADCQSGFVCQPPKLTPNTGGLHQASTCVPKGQALLSSQPL